MGEVADYLTSKGCHVRQSGPTEFHTHCMFCGEDTNKRGRLYFQDDPMVEPKGLFKCFVCDERGAYNKLRKHYGDPILTDDSTIRSEVSLRLLEAANTYFMNSTTPEVYKYLMEERGLELDTIENHRFGYDGGGLYKHLVGMGFDKDQIAGSGLIRKNNTDFLNGCITIPYITNGQVVAIRGKQVGGKYLTPPGNGARLFNVDNLHGATEVVVCEGEFDSIVVEQMGYPAVGVPGANTWQNNWDNYVSGLDHIYICFDNDAAGQTGADKLASRFSGKAKVIQLPEGDHSDISDWYVAGRGGQEDFDVLLKRSRGGLLCTVDDAFDEWLQVEGNPDLEGIKLGFALLDEVLKPGITPGQVFVLLAKTGVGKSIFAMNIFHRMVTMQPDKKILFLSLEQTRGEWFERARRIHKFYDPWATEKDTIELYRNKLMIVDKNKVTPQEMENILDQFAETAGKQPDFCVVDYLGYWARGFKGESYERTTSAMMSMKAIAKDRRIAFMAPHQVSRTTEIGEEINLNSAKECITGDTRIILADGRYERIDCLGRSDVIVGVDSEYKIKPMVADKIWKKNSQREVFKVVTSSGRVIRGTSEHPLMTAMGWSEISNLVVGDRVAVPRELPFFGDENFEHSELLGSLIADGGLTSSPVTYCEGHADIRKRVEFLASRIGVTSEPCADKEAVRFPYRGQSRKNPLTEMLREFGIHGLKSPDRFIPGRCFSFNEASVARLLKGLFNSDGSVVKCKSGRTSISYVTASETLARDVQHLLTRFGIWSNLSTEYVPESYTDKARRSSGIIRDGWIWRIVIERFEDMDKFRSKIGFSGGKSAKLDDVLSVRLKKANCIDLFPSELMEEVHESRVANGLGWSVLSKTGNPKKTSIVKGRDISRDRLSFYANAVGSERLMALSNGDVEFDRIVSIESDGVEAVYDAHVPVHHNFIAGDIVVHNSGAVEETADFLAGIWTPDQRKGTERSERGGKVILKLLKSRRGGVGTQVEYQFAPATLALVAHGEKEYARAVAEHRMVLAKDTFEQVMERHRSGDMNIRPNSRYNLD